MYVVLCAGWYQNTQFVSEATAVVLGLAKSYKLGFGTCFTNMYFVVFCKKITRTQSGMLVSLFFDSYRSTRLEKARAR